MLSLLLFSRSAAAFCGTFVGGTDVSLINHSSQVVLARIGERVTLTVAADFSGDAADFALILPVPEVLDADDVRTVDPTLIQRLDTYSTPRAVAYTCADLGYGVFGGASEGSTCRGIGCADYSLMDQAKAGSLDSAAYYGDKADNSVQVESSFTVANYDIVVLSAEESGDLEVWLDNNGYALPPGGGEILQEYIDAGVFFLAAKVHLDDAVAGTTWLPPLQFSYTSAVFGLPIRIGTISATTEQEVVIYTLADSEVRISNYPERTVETECMPEGELGEHYASVVADTFEEGAGWVLEHSWYLGQVCDPCTSPDPFTVEELGELGFTEGDTGHYGSYLGHLTRLRLRYTPEQATADVTLYETGTNPAYQTRYITYDQSLEATFPVCGKGLVEGGGTCDAAVEEPEAAGCAAGGVNPRLGLLLGLVGLVARRRR